MARVRNGGGKRGWIPSQTGGPPDFFQRGVFFFKSALQIKMSFIFFKEVDLV